MLKKLKNFKWGYILIFIMLAVVGVCFIAFHNTLSAVALTMGIILAIYGIIMVTLALADRRRGASFAFKIIIGIIAIICGVVTAVFRDGAIEILASLIALFLIIDGSFKLQTTAMSKRYKLISWWFMLIPAVLVILGGFVTLRISPSIASDGAKTISIILGLTMIVDAFSNLFSAFYISKYESNMINEIREQLSEEAAANNDNAPPAADETEAEQNAEFEITEEALTDQLEESAMQDDTAGKETNVHETSPEDEVLENPAESTDSEDKSIDGGKKKRKILSVFKRKKQS